MNTIRRAALMLVCLVVAATLPVTGQVSRAGGPPPAGALPGPPPSSDPAGTGAISGVVRDGNTHAPIAGAMVYLGIQGHGPAVRTSREVTDAKGRFVFIGLPVSDAFFMNVNKAGYNDGHYGVDSPEGGSAIGSGLISLAAGQWFPSANINMWRPGVIAGTVTDERGEPVVNAHVRVLARLMIAGLPHLAASSTTTTDDRGRYRISGLPNGSFIVSVPSVQHAVPAETGPLTIEGLTPASAANVDSDTPRRNGGALEAAPGTLLIIGSYATAPLAAGKTAGLSDRVLSQRSLARRSERRERAQRRGARTTIDFSLRPTATVRVSGVVDGPPEAVRGLVLRLMPAGLEDLGEGSEAATTLAGADGRFTFLNVPAGAYTVDATKSTLEFMYGPSAGLASQELPGTPGRLPGASSLGSLLSGTAWDALFIQPRVRR